LLRVNQQDEQRERTDARLIDEIISQRCEDSTMADSHQFLPLLPPYRYQ